MTILLLIVIYSMFVSLGLPNGILGAAWEPMRSEFQVGLAAASPIAMILGICAVVSSLLCEKFMQKVKTQYLTAFAILMSSLSLLGYSFSGSFIWLLVLAVPLGISAGLIDASLNNYVALHYESRHVSWLHCFWAVGSLLGPLIMAFFLDREAGWRGGYRGISIILFCIFVLLLFASPLWKYAPRALDEKAEKEESKKVPLSQIAGVAWAPIAIFLYAATEKGLSLWAASYFSEVMEVGVSTAARWSSFIFMGITVGRVICGFLTFRMNNVHLIRLGIGIMLAGTILFVLPLPHMFTLAGVILVGFGCSPILPCMIHETPRRFGIDRSQQIIGITMAASAASGVVSPPFIGMLAQYTIGIKILPFIILLFTILILVSSEKLNAVTKKNLLKETGQS